MTYQDVLHQISEQEGELVKLLNSSNPVPPNRISDVGTKLAILNALLGGFLPGLKEEQIIAEKRIFATAKEDKKSDTAAKEIVRYSTTKERKAYETVEIRHNDIWKLISMAQTHIRAEREERKS